MPLFKRKDPYAIPPVAGGGAISPTSHSNTNSQPSRSPHRSNAATYNASRDGDPYNYPSNYSNYSNSSNTLVSPPPPGTENELRDKYSRSRGVGDVYSRGGGELDKDRNELFAGYNPNKAGSGRFFDGPQAGAEPTPGEENDEDIEGIKKQTRFVKQESVLRLGDQSGMYCDSLNFSREIDMSSDL
jgi:hypothetical protein